MTGIPGAGRPFAGTSERPVFREVAMVTVTKTDTRADIAECMANLTKTTASLKRRGHEGTHKSCEDCDRYAIIHANLNALITSWERAPR